VVLNVLKVYGGQLGSGWKFFLEVGGHKHCVVGVLEEVEELVDDP